MKTTSYEVEVQYTRKELEALFDLARREDVEEGGRYDARSGAINVWSHAWINETTRHDSETIGTFYVHWLDENCIYLIECDERFSLDDLLLELAVLEEKALGRVKHYRGVWQTSSTCSWCDAKNPVSVATCQQCGHNAHRPRMLCTCPQCKPRGV